MAYPATEETTGGMAADLHAARDDQAEEEAEHPYKWGIITSIRVPRVCACVWEGAPDNKLRPINE